MNTRQLATVVIAAAVTGGICLGAGVAVGTHLARAGQPSDANGTSREFMVQVMGVRTPNQGGHTLNLFFHYRYDTGIADNQIPDYRKLRLDALDYLRSADLSHNPLWETLNHQLCAQLKANYPIQAISCEMQVVGTEDPAEPGGPGYRASIETIGDLGPLTVVGPRP